MDLGNVHSFPERKSDSYLFFFPAAPLQVVDLHDHVILLPREPLNSNAGVCGPGHWAQNVITEEKATESDKIFTQTSRRSFSTVDRCCWFGTVQRWICDGTSLLSEVYLLKQYWVLMDCPEKTGKTLIHSVEDERRDWPWSNGRRRSHLCSVWRICRIHHEQLHLREGRSRLRQHDRPSLSRLACVPTSKNMTRKEDLAWMWMFLRHIRRILPSHLWIRDGLCFRILTGTVPGVLHLLNLSVVELCVSKIFPSCRPPDCSVWRKHLLWNWRGRKKGFDFFTRLMSGYWWEPVVQQMSDQAYPRTPSRGFR